MGGQEAPAGHWWCVKGTLCETGSAGLFMYGGGSGKPGSGNGWWRHLLGETLLGRWAKNVGLRRDC